MFERVELCPLLRAPVDDFAEPPDRLDADLEDPDLEADPEDLDDDADFERDELAEVDFLDFEADPVPFDFDEVPAERPDFDNEPFAEVERPDFEAVELFDPLPERPDEERLDDAVPELVDRFVVEDFPDEPDFEAVDFLVDDDFEPEDFFEEDDDLDPEDFFEDEDDFDPEDFLVAAMIFLSRFSFN